jgi:hypothetical protein
VKRASLVIVGLLWACTTTENLPPLPEGPQTLTGVLLSTELSLSRRGTHLFQVENDTSGEPYFAESSTVPLRRYEGKTVLLRGRFERNVSPEDPAVLVVEAIEAVLEETTKHWSVASLRLSFDAPDSWRVDIQDERVDMSVSSLLSPLVTVEREDLPEEIPAGEPIVIDRIRATLRASEGTDAEEVLIEQDDKLLRLRFDPHGSEHRETLHRQWRALLATIDLTGTGGSASASSRAVPTPVPSGSGATPGTVSACGGPAGILCPAGFYCQVENLQENIGRCEPL